MPWQRLDDKLKVLSCNSYTIHDAIKFAEEVRHIDINPCDILVSDYVASLFTSIPIDETIYILADRVFNKN